MRGGYEVIAGFTLHHVLYSKWVRVNTCREIGTGGKKKGRNRDNIARQDTDDIDIVYF